MANFGSIYTVQAILGVFILKSRISLATNSHFLHVLMYIESVLFFKFLLSLLVQIASHVSFLIAIQSIRTLIVLNITRPKTICPCECSFVLWNELRIA